MNVIRINPENGHFIVNEEITIFPEITIEELKKLLRGIVEIHDNNGDWWSASVRNYYDGENYFILSFQFFRNVFIAIDISMRVEPFGIPDGSGWDLINYDDEMKNVAKNNAWLTSRLGENRIFSWGSATAGFDERGFCPYMYVRYLAFDTVYGEAMRAQTAAIRKTQNL